MQGLMKPSLTVNGLALNDVEKFFLSRSHSK